MQINDKKICVISSLATADDVKSNGIYQLKKDGVISKKINFFKYFYFQKIFVDNIFYQPDDECLLKSSSLNGKYYLVFLK